MQFIASHRRWPFVRPAWVLGPVSGSGVSKFVEFSVTFRTPITPGSNPDTRIRFWDYGSDPGSYHGQIAGNSPKITWHSYGFRLSFPRIPDGQFSPIYGNSYEISIDTGFLVYQGVNWGLPRLSAEGSPNWVVQIAAFQPPVLVSTVPDYTDPLTVDIPYDEQLNVTITFDKPVILGADGTYRLQRYRPGGANIPVLEFASDNSDYVGGGNGSSEVYLNIPGENLDPAESYTLSFTDRVVLDWQDPTQTEVGNAELAPGTWVFRTADPPPAPTISPSSPVPGAVGVAMDAQFSVSTSNTCTGAGQVLVYNETNTLVADGSFYVIYLDGQAGVSWNSPFWPQPGAEYRFDIVNVSVHDQDTGQTAVVSPTEWTFTMADFTLDNYYPNGTDLDPSLISSFGFDGSPSYFPDFVTTAEVDVWNGSAWVNLQSQQVTIYSCSLSNCSFSFSLEYGKTYRVRTARKSWTFSTMAEPP